VNRTAGEVLVDTLADLGVRRYYTVPGESFLDVLEATRTRRDATLISARHESGAGFMAEAEAKLTGKVAVALATRAPGAANLAIGVHTAFHDSTPMVVLLGQVDSRIYGRGLAFQEIDLAGFYRPITKWQATLSRPQDAEEIAQQAVSIATTGRPGPVVVVLPGDVLGERATEGAGDRLAGSSDMKAREGTTDGSGSGASAPSPAALGELRSILEDASSPVLIVGGRTAGLSARLVELAETYSLGVYSAFRRQDHFPNEHPCYLGHLTLAPSPDVLASLRDADVVLALGCRLSEVTTQRFSLPSSRTLLVHVDADATGPTERSPRRLGGAERVGALERSVPAMREPDLVLAADVAAVVDGLLSGAGDRARSDRWERGHRAYLDDSTPPPGRASDRLDPTALVAAMAELLPDDAVVASDAGNFSIALHRFWRYRHPRTQLAPTSGAMGYAIPASIAAGIVCPERLAVAVVGDGGYLMTGQEIETAVRYRTKIVVLAVRNGLYGTIAMHQARTFGATWGVDIGPVDIAAHARSLGAAGFTATDWTSLRVALARSVDAAGPAVVDVVVDPDAITPTASLATMLDAWAQGHQPRGTAGLGEAPDSYPQREGD
jgi:acetolactate synthase-1/2/3 large subunit